MSSARQRLTHGPCTFVHLTIDMQKVLIFLIPALFTGCIGTDLIDEALGPVPTRIDFPVESVSLLAGESQQLAAEVIASDGNPAEVQVTWESRNPGIATVSPSGLLEAVSPGQTFVFARTPTLLDSLLITVSIDPNALASISIQGPGTDLMPGDTLKLLAVLSNGNGEQLSGISVSWNSQQPEVCSVDPTGQVLALAQGRATITAMAEGISSPPYTISVSEGSTSRTGTFQGLSGYNVSGMATLEPSTDGHNLIFSDAFRSQSGPGLYVYLSPNATNVTGGVSLGVLKATSGTQLYEVASSVNTEDMKYVIIYCQPFSVPFGHALLE